MYVNGAGGHTGLASSWANNARSELPELLAISGRLPLEASASEVTGAGHRCFMRRAFMTKLVIE